MEPPPPVKPPRGVKPQKETSGLLMSVIRALSVSESNEQRDREKAKLEAEYKICDQRLDELVCKHEGDLAEVMQIFSALSQQVSESKEKVRRVKENLKACKTLLHCQRDELKNLWQEGLEYKYMLQLLEEIDKINDLPNRLTHHLNRKQYLHATKLIIEAVSLGKDSLEGVEGLKEYSQELIQKKDNMHQKIMSEIKSHLYIKPSQHVLALHRQGSARDGAFNSQFRRSTELRRSAKNRASARRNLMESTPQFQNKTDEFEVEENLDVIDQEANSSHFKAILVKCLVLLEKLPFALEYIEAEIETELLNVVQRTTYHINDFVALQNGDNKQAQSTLTELVETLFDQLKEIAQAHITFLNHVNRAIKQHKLDCKPYEIHHVWVKIQYVLQLLLVDYLDIQSMANGTQSTETFVGDNDISSYFAKRKQAMKKKTLFKFDGSSSALTMQSCLKDSPGTKTREKILVTQPDPNNVMLIFMPFICFIEEIEQSLNIPNEVHCELHKFLSKYIEEDFLKQKSLEISSKIQETTSASDAWKATVLLDVTTDYKPLLVSTVTVETAVREWRSVLQAIPLYGDLVVSYAIDTLKDYKAICHHAYQKIVQPPSEDRRICSAAWLKDEDISRFLKSLPNWVNLKNQQEYQARNERKKVIRREHTLDEESPEDVRQRNRKEAEILAGNLGEGGVSASEILSNMMLLKELAQLQESMEWFSVRMLQFTSEFRKEPTLSPIINAPNADTPPPISSTNLQQLTSIAQDFDELANTCLLLLHLEVRVQCFHYLLAQTEYNKETHEPDPKVLELSRVLANVDEAMTSSLHPRKCKYIFEGLGHLIAKILISSAQYMKIIDEVGIQRMCRNVFALQQTLTNITMTREVALDHARHYYELFFSTPYEILNTIMERGAEFSELEYMNAFQLLHRSKSSKKLGNINDHLERLSNILGEVGVTV